MAIGTKETASGRIAPRRRDIGLGAYPEVPLKEARERARNMRDQVRNGYDPVEERQARKAARQADLNQRLLFRDAVELAARLEGIKDDKAGKAWRYKLETYAVPTLGPLPVAKIDRHDVAKALAPIWTTKTRTAKDVRMLTARVIDRAYADRRIDRNNPAKWDKSLEQLLPKQKIQGGHFKALPYTQVNAVLGKLQADKTNAARVVEFIVYTVVRTNEATGATWGEIDLERRIWTIPAERMKKGEEHRVYLSDPAVAILEGQPKGEPTDLIFPTQTGKAHKDARTSKVLREIANGMGLKATVHGLRATFRTWAEEKTDYPEPLLEMSLAHKIGDDVKRAYQRGDLLEKRQVLMSDWAAYCAKPSPKGEVVTMQGATA